MCLLSLIVTIQIFSYRHVSLFYVYPRRDITIKSLSSWNQFQITWMNPVLAKSFSNVRHFFSYFCIKNLGNRLMRYICHSFRINMRSNSWHIEIWLTGPYLTLFSEQVALKYFNLITCITKVSIYLLKEEICILCLACYYSYCCIHAFLPFLLTLICSFISIPPCHYTRVMGQF